MNEVLTSYLKSLRLPFHLNRRKLRPLGLPLFLLGILITAALPKAKAQTYCTPSYSSGCAYQDDINSFTLTGYLGSNISDLNTGCTTGGYADKTTTVAAVNLMQGGNYNGTINSEYSGSEYAQIWIDFNNDGTFSTTEAVCSLIGGTTGFGTTPVPFSIAIPLTATTGAHRMRVRLAYYTTPTIDPCASYTYGETHDYTATIVAAPVCTGAPTITSVTPAGPLTTCAGTQQTLTVNVPVASGYTFQWEDATSGTGPWTPIAGATSPVFSFTATASKYYHCIVTCTNSSQASTSAAVQVSVAPPTYTTLPYFQDFESWQTYCSNTDVPSSNWSNQPATGNSSWRRDDQGTTANWTSIFTYATPAVLPFYKSGAHSARFHSYTATSNVPGNLDLYLDCSGSTDPKQLYFHYYDAFYSSPTYLADSLTIWLSTNGGTSFTQIGGCDSAAFWKRKSFAIPSSSAQTVIRFSGRKYGSYDYSDIFLDSVYVAPACSGQPVAGNVTPGGTIFGCNGISFPLTTTGTSLAGNLTYQWQMKINNTTVWVPAVGGTGANTLNYTTPTLTDTIQYRLMVTCGGSGLKDSTAPVIINIAPPQYATLPYFQDFENWSTYCSTTDVPSYNWSNQPSMGNSSWRRDDQGTSAAWTSIYSYGTPAVLPFYKSGAHSARFHSYTATVNTPGNLDLYLNCSGSTTPKQLYFYYYDAFYSSPSYANDSLTVWLSTNGGTTFTQIGGYDSTNTWTRRTLAIPSSSAQTVVRFAGRKWGTSDYSDIFLDSVYVAPSCSGQPAAGVIPMASPVNGCPGSTYQLTANGTTLAGNLTYQWLQQVNGSSTWVPATGPGATSLFFSPTVYDTIKYRMVVKCLGSSLVDTTAAVVFNVAKPVYATIPFVEDFESWVSRCNTTEVPSFNWTNFPATGNSSFRRNDQGASAAWTSATSGFTAPLAAKGTYSARWHGYTANPGMSGAGKLDLFVNCASITGPKELQFYMKTYNSTTPQDSVKVFLSTDGGQTFSLIGGYGPVTSGAWDLKTLPVVSNSATTVIRFQTTDIYTGYGDIGLDYVRVLPPCAGTPTAGTVAPVTPCPNVNFNLSLNNTSQSAGLTYQWQESNTGVPGSWTNIAGSTQAIATSNIAAPKYFRCVVTCTNSSQADTTAGYQANLAPFYVCYCQNSSNSNYAQYGYGSIGNYTIKTQPANSNILNNGVATPLLNNPNGYAYYTDFTNLAPTVMYRDSLYKFFVTQTVGGSYFYTGYGAIYVDLDRNGVYDPTDRIMFKPMNNTATQQFADTFRIPGAAATGLTGMRVILYPMGSTINPCGIYNYGETEDYLADIRLAPCDGPSNPGLVIASDTAMCTGYPLTLIDTSYEKTRSGLARVWQKSTDFGGSWNSMAGFNDKDTVTDNFAGVSWYRLKMTCTITGDSTFSNIAKVNIKPAYKCYCYSTAIGGNKDTSDIGAFSIGNFIVNTGGPHLINPGAITGRGDHTDFGPVELFVDSSYEVNVFHTMPNKIHGDALVTLFMDFNNNLQYDIPAERIVLSDSISSINGWYMINNITIPSAAVLNVPTGMRVIMNNNVGYNVPSYTACGSYTSGETEDYVVTFRKGWPLGVGSLTNLKDLSIYPNPTVGRFVLSFNADKLVKDLKVQVTTVTGQQIMQEVYNNVGTSFNKEFNISEHARGIYFVEITADGEKMIRKLVVN